MGAALVDLQDLDPSLRTLQPQVAVSEIQLRTHHIKVMHVHRMGRQPELDASDGIEGFDILERQFRLSEDRLRLLGTSLSH